MTIEKKRGCVIKIIILPKLVHCRHTHKHSHTPTHTHIYIYINMCVCVYGVKWYVLNLLRVFNFFLDPVGLGHRVSGRVDGERLLNDALILSDPLHAHHPLLQGRGIAGAKEHVL